MQRRFTNIDIDHFFRSLDRLDPLYDENKVHQIISSPEAMARLKGKPFKPLKFILMTTLFAVIVTAILLWTGKPEQAAIQKNLTQTQFNENIQTENETPNLDQKNEADPVTNEVVIPETKTEPVKPVAEAQPDNEANKKVSDQKEVLPSTVLTETASTPKSKPLTPPETIKGNLRMVVADQALLEKLGFQFIDESVFYKNKWGKTKYEQAVYRYEVNEYSKVLVRLHRFNNNDSIHWTSFNFYPVAESYRSGELKSSLGQEYNLELGNDTLFPIYCPALMINNEPNDIVFWFTITREFIQQLPKDKQHFAKEIIARKKIKDQYPDKNLIDYTPEPLIDSSRFIELSKKQLMDFGFSIEYDSTLFKDADGYVKRALLTYFMTTDSRTIGIKYTKSGSSSSNDQVIHKQYSSHPQLSFITNVSGDFEFKIDSNGLSEALQLIPVVVRKDLFDDVVDKDRVYWFKLSDKLFKALPEQISKDLQKEYNYIVADNKEELEKPECKYFDECKNTLLIGNFKVFPNPANQRTTVTFTLPETIDGRISLVDLAGRERQVLLPETTLSSGHQRFDFDLLGISEGLYLITLYSDQGIQMQRLIVSH